MAAIPKGKPVGRIKPRRVIDPRHIAKVRQLPCCVCGHSPVEAHHIKGGFGLSVKASDLETIPLCSSCHRTGNHAIHNGWHEWEAKHGTQRDFLAATLEKLKGAA